MESNIEYMDLLYFGYYDDAGSGEDQAKFMKEIKEKFPNTEFQDAFDDIKGYRQEVFMEKKNEDNYYAWLIGEGWFECSLSMQLIMMSAGKEPKNKGRFDKYFALAKEQYPHNFKSEELSGK